MTIMHRIAPLIVLTLLLGPLSLRAQTPDRTALRRTPVVEVFENSKDAVVNIATTKVVEVRESLSPFDDLFDFGLFPSRTRRFQATSVGSGFVIHPAGYICTNAHVVARTAEQKVIFSDEQAYDAQIVAIDHDRDVAILKIEPQHPLKPLPLGTSGDLMIGETVIAIGNPLGYQHTVTSGVVSAVNRDLDVPDPRGGQSAVFEGLIQTDASINPGNSGGPLLNVLGELIGVNTAIRADAQNIGFAIPVDRLREVLPRMLDVERRYRLIIGLKVGGAERCLVREVAPGSPAEGAGLQPGDVITRIGDTPIENDIDYHIALVTRRAGETLVIHFEREGRPREAQFRIGQRPQPDGVKLLSQRFGLEAQPLTERQARRVGIATPRGLIVTGVERRSPAGDAGLQVNDIILQVERYQPSTMEEVGELLEEVKTGDAVTFRILRIRSLGVVSSLENVRARLIAR